MTFLAELKRRNVIRMAGLYLVGAWLVTQVAATLLPVFEAPAWVMKALLGVLAIGFFVAVGFAWVFELTPDGLKRDAQVDPPESIAPRTARERGGWARESWAARGITFSRTGRAGTRALSSSGLAASGFRRWHNPPVLPRGLINGTLLDD